MAKPPKEQDERRDNADLAPNAWERFERAVDVVAKSKPRPKRKDGNKPISGKSKANASEKKAPR